MELDDFLIKEQVEDLYDEQTIQELNEFHDAIDKQFEGHEQQESN